MGGNIFATATGTGVTSVATGAGLTGGPITGTGTISPDYTTADNIILAAPNVLGTVVNNDKLIVNDSTAGNEVKEVTLSTIKTYIGAGTGTVTGTGTANQIAKWSSTSAIADSSIADTGSLVTISSATKVTGDLELDADLIDINGDTGSAGQVLSSLGGGGAGVDWIPAPVSYTKWVLTGQSGSEDILDNDTVLVTSGNTAITTAVTATDTLTITSTAYGGGATIGHVPSGGTAGTFLQGDGTWAAAGGGSRKVDTGTGDNTTVDFTMTQAFTSVDYVDVYISGVYQQKSTYTQPNGTGTTLLRFNTAPPVTASNGIDFVINY